MEVTVWNGDNLPIFIIKFTINEKDNLAFRREICEKHLRWDVHVNRDFRKMYFLYIKVPPSLNEKTGIFSVFF